MEASRLKLASRSILLAVWATAVLAAGCVQSPAPLAVSPWWVHYETGDRLELAEQQLGLGPSGPRLEAGGDLLGPGAPRLRCGPAGGGPHPAFQVQVAAAGPRPATLTLTIPHFAGGHGRDLEATARLLRMDGDGRLRESTGSARLTLDTPGHRAGTYAATGSFEAQLQGEAGQGRMSGRFEGCRYFG